MWKSKKLVLLFTGALVLAACSNQVKNATETLTAIKTEETDIVAQFNGMQQLETELQTSFEESLSADEKLATFKDGSAKVFENIAERRDSAKKIESALADLVKTKGELIALDEKTLPLEDIKAFGSTVDALNDSSKTYLEAYKTSLDKEEEILSGFGGDDATFDTFYAGIASINADADANQANMQAIVTGLTAVENQLTALETAIASLDDKKDAAESSAATDSSSATAEKAAVKDAVKKAEPVAYTYQINPKISSVEPIAADGETQVALLTFDDTPQQPDSHAVAIAETLKAKGANAIFFVVGQFLESEQAKKDLKTISDMGFEIGNHSYTHPDFLKMSYDEQLAEISKTNDAIEAVTGKRPRFLRAPYGQWNDDTATIAAAEGMTMMNWTYGYDWVAEYMDGPALADVMVNSQYLGDGANLLMHDRPWTSEAIGSIIDGLRAKNFTIVDPTLIASPERKDSL
jgi:peptidoglycan/xylan/chitin deacetylase (PgdA/CDA1 family)